MPNGEQETPIASAEVDPDLVVWLLTNVSDAKVPNYRYRSEMLRELADQHEQLGEARGQARAVLAVLDTRGVAVPAAVREQVLACTDLARLDIWLDLAVNAVTADDVIRG